MGINLDALVSLAWTQWAAVNWVEIGIPLALTVIAWCLGRFSSALLAGLNPRLSNYLGEYHCYHVSWRRQRNIVESRFRVYRTIFGTVRVREKYLDLADAYVGMAYAVGSSVHFRLRDKKNKFESHYIFPDPIIARINIVCGSFCSTTMDSHPVAGIKLLSAKPLEDSEIRSLIGKCPALQAARFQDCIELGEARAGTSPMPS
ncbi:hypothetical protein V4F39_01710 [Aquincola sp. MAHUQ-54]|uniref:Uncharacterized protein n=1 Tax=Aquincola agrisoli TaxID=3119538 RepID=A0AAW9Q7G6_9BURK